MFKIHVGLFVVFLPGFLTQNFTILRRQEEPDKIISSYKIKKDNTINKDGSCVDAKRTIASYNQDQNLGCYDDGSLAHLGNEYCGHGFDIVATKDTILTNCKFSQVLSVNLWNIYEWRDLTRNSKSEIQISANRLVLEDRRRWDGLLVRIFVRCGNNPDEKCITYKFTGVRKYPLLEDPQEIWKTSQTDNPYKKTNVQPKKTTETENSSSNSGTVAGVVIACLLVICLAVALMLHMRRKKRQQEIQKRRDPSVYASTTIDVTYKQSNTDDQQITMQTKSEYATPAVSEPKYCKLQPIYNDGTDRVQPVRKETEDVSENVEEKLLASGYKAPSTGHQGEEEMRELLDSGIYQEPSSPTEEVFDGDRENLLAAGYKMPKVNDPEEYDTPIYDSKDATVGEKMLLYATVEKDRK